MTPNYGMLPEQAQEDALHPTRLLMIEERPFNRIRTRLTETNSLIRERPTGLASPPPEGGHEDANPTAQDEQKLKNFREDTLIDFAFYDNSLVRMQLVHTREQRERDRYATQKQKIEETAKAVKDNTAELKDDLEVARNVMAQKKKYDVLAEKILSDKRLPAREENQEAIKKLQKEIEDLEAEDREFEEMWAARRAAFDKIQAEGQAALNMIKGIKEAVEEDKGDDNEADGDADGKEASVGGGHSRVGTPGPEGSTPRPDADTPLPDAGDDDINETAARPTNRFLEVDGANRANNRKPWATTVAYDPMAGGREVTNVRSADAIAVVKAADADGDTDADTEMGNAVSGV